MTCAEIFKCSAEVSSRRSDLSVFDSLSPVTSGHLPVLWQDDGGVIEGRMLPIWITCHADGTLHSELCSS